MNLPGRLVVARESDRLARRRDRVFADFPGLFGDPGWEILKGLYVDHCLKGQSATTRAATAGGTAPTTGLRHLYRLFDRGLVSHGPDADDRRGRLFSLTETGMALMEETLDPETAFGSGSSGSEKFMILVVIA